jgi:exodeoxyribonuclease-5
MTTKESPAPLGSGNGADRSGGIDWSADQRQALARVGDWFEGSGEQVFGLEGPAGSRKSTIAVELDKHLGCDVAFGTYTGKAASVLQRKGCDTADTLDALVYRRPAWWTCAQTDCKKPPCQKLCRHARIHYGEKKLWIDGPLSKAGAVVIDEASMVNDQLAADLLSFNVKVLAVGDPYQLPPIHGPRALLSGSTGYLLTEVHRQALGSPIIRMATTVRTGGYLTLGQYGTSAVQRGGRIEDEQLLDADAGTHAMRRRINAHVREILGYSGPPRVGEKILCTRNARSKGLQNGTVWTVLSVGFDDPWFVSLEIADDRGKTAEVNVLMELFDGDIADQTEGGDGTAGEQFCWGYCLTCHKSQGSEWDRVLVIDESAVFRKDRTAWLYTSITRAADVLTVVRR